MANHFCPHRVQLNVLRAGQQISSAVDEGGPIASFPQRASPPTVEVEVLDVPAAKRLERFRNAVRLVWGEEQVDMVSHQDVGVDSTPMLGGSGSQTVAIQPVVLLGPKNRTAVIPALDHAGFCQFHQPACSQTQFSAVHLVIMFPE